MFSRRRRAQLGLISACLTLVTMLSIISWGIIETSNGKHRVGLVGQAPSNVDANIKLAALER